MVASRHPDGGGAGWKLIAFRHPYGVRALSLRLAEEAAMSDPRSVLVGGATGQQGGAVARLLLEKGHRVVALTRKPESESAARLTQAGVEVAVGSFDDGSALERAMRGVDAVFTMSTPFEGWLGGLDPPGDCCRRRRQLCRGRAPRLFFSGQRGPEDRDSALRQQIRG